MREGTNTNRNAVKAKMSRPELSHLRPLPIIVFIAGYNPCCWDHYLPTRSKNCNNTVRLSMNLPVGVRRPDDKSARLDIDDVKRLLASLVDHPVPVTNLQPRMPRSVHFKVQQTCSGLLDHLPERGGTQSDVSATHRRRVHGRSRGLIVRHGAVRPGAVRLGAVRLASRVGSRLLDVVQAARRLEHPLGACAALGHLLDQIPQELLRLARAFSQHLPAEFALPAEVLESAEGAEARLPR
mmetsp:Transcript_48321/g.154974  ORF Transcript_48321/g.154974 Transcript_48321/m.154974 type:complete len:239 (-) Transcript_48321:507-1223(-)